MAGVRWGAVEAFPTPAYWAFQVLARRVQGTRINFKLGTTLREELGACLLGGHGIPASVGLAAYEQMKALGAFAGPAPDETTLYSWLSGPISVGNRTVRYRFAKQKAKYLSGSLAMLDRASPPENSGRELRDWLLNCPGIGAKTASWIARNWLDADDVAILDIHILRAGILAGFFPKNLKVENHYLQLESLFLAFSKGLGVRASELDALIWWEMMSSGATVSRLLGGLSLNDGKGRARNSNAHASNLALVA